MASMLQDIFSSGVNCLALGAGGGLGGHDDALFLFEGHGGFFDVGGLEGAEVWGERERSAK